MARDHQPNNPSEKDLNNALLGCVLFYDGRLCIG